jgi:hypothetical protein
VAEKAVLDRFRCLLLQRHSSCVKDVGGSRRMGQELKLLFLCKVVSFWSKPGILIRHDPCSTRLHLHKCVYNRGRNKAGDLRKRSLVAHLLLALL